MNKTYILEADPTRCGGIQQFVRDAAGYLPSGEVVLLAYYADLAHEKSTEVPLIMLNARRGRSFWSKLFGGFRFSYLSFSSLKRNISLLLDIPRIRRNLSELLPGGDILILNSASAMLLFCTTKVLRANKIIMVQHTAPRQMYTLPYYFGGIFRKLKISLYRKYVDAFVMLSPFEEKELASWLPLDGKHTTVIRHAVSRPSVLPDTTPAAVAVLSRLESLKRIDRVIKCAKLRPDIQFNIYGSGPSELSLKTMAQHLVNVKFHGFTNDIHRVFCDNSILMVTSDFEGYPISGIEACVHGRPVIVLNTFPAASDLVEHNVSGLVVNDGTPQTLSAAVTQIFSAYDNFHSGALAHSELYNPVFIRQQWLELIQKLSV